jgi:endoglucanase
VDFRSGKPKQIIETDPKKINGTGMKLLFSANELENSLTAMIDHLSRRRCSKHRSKARIYTLSAAAIRTAALALLLSIGVTHQARSANAFNLNRTLGRGVNLGTAFESQHDGACGVPLTAEVFRTIRRAGFDSIRIPVRWSTHAAAEYPYEIDAGFLKHVDWAINQALSNNLTTVIDVHHYDEMDQQPEQNLPRLLAIWKQIAEHYQKYSDRLLFELLNEPHGQLTEERWQHVFPQLLAVIRESNPKRVVVIGPGSWNSLESLASLELPEKDRRIILTFHYYSPFRFTHQGAGWVDGSAAWLGTRWTGDSADRDALKKDFESVARWGKKSKRPIYLGEFGAYSAADMSSRERWTHAVVRQAEQREFSWAYWEFCSGFGLFDPNTGKWRKGLLGALMGKF